ncbi:MULTISPECIES: DUF2612 domain-containing protein [Enterobacter]|uniref:DUF2612 domain-containing protein n=1 Tax=Enterobacter TaxID=547 RepID=UPI000797B791|nr:MULTISPECIES: DUF2612 domain-containing protein [Enterobacter]MCU3030592.1 DUF2612 domain-containing protein [Enterobacter hormaechei subsp. hoffmannii]CAF3211308.1 hypothetical protein AI3013V2_1061 [Enterobacter cloacae]EKS6325051.1 DUF2612 domain-containing protein [Enterobacter hormaechei]MCA2400621.1 DUF2612 domain-containing protein [Enterobacter sp. CCUG 70166]MDU7899849.1 DUF2612 domain-containing protein [Enterobacter hormaechei]
MWQDTILTQYSASQKLLSIIDTFNQAVSLDDFTDEFIEKVWDLTTCETFGLDMWGAIVGVSRYVIAPIDNESFGFSEANDYDPEYPTPFNDAPFFGGMQETTNIRLGDDAYRTLIMCKAFTNISIATTPDINKFLKIMFYKRGRAYCINYRDMTMGITFEFELAPYEESILTNYEVAPVPSGVLVNIRQVVSPYFGFSSDSYPFNDGTFYRD